MSRHYVIEKFTNAMSALATGAGDVRSRLIVAHQCLHTLSAEDFPTDLRSDWAWIKEQLTRFGSVTNSDGEVLRGSVEHTMSRIHNRTGVKIAKRIEQLYWELSRNDRYS